jgi:NitT/TauT family transport system substrate-binding protein
VRGAGDSRTGRGRAAAGTLAFVLVAVLLASTLAGCGGPAADKVSLQLNWYHQAEFAGYYVAQEKGFYKQQHLEVEIRGGGPGTPGRDAVLNGNATFAVTSFGEQHDLVKQNKPGIAIMALYQIPPLVIFSLSASDIDQPGDLIGKRVGTTTSYWKNVLSQTLTAAGIDPASVTAVDVKPDQMNLLYEGQVDAWLGYAQDEPIKAQMAGHMVTDIYPADFGVGGYEGLLITNQSTIDTRPDVVRRFVKGTYDGWRYALEHPDEAADIIAKWAPDNSVDFEKLAFRALAPLVDVPQVPVGWIDSARWQQLMGEDFDENYPGYTMQFSPVTP